MRVVSPAPRADPILVGAAFAIAWTPWVGSTLGAILPAASLSGSATRGAYLMAWHSAGLALPRLATAIFFDHATTAFAVVKRYYRAVLPRAAWC